MHIRSFSARPFQDLAQSLSTILTTATVIAGSLAMHCLSRLSAHCSPVREARPIFALASQGQSAPFSMTLCHGAPLRDPVATALTSSGTFAIGPLPRLTARGPAPASVQSAFVAEEHAGLVKGAADAASPRRVQASFDYSALVKCSDCGYIK